MAMQRVAIVDPTESTRESLRTLLLGVDFVWLDNECARYEYFADVIQDAPPELVIVALDADKGKALQLIQQLAAEHPSLPILTISHDHQALLQSLQKGAKYFFTHPVGLQDILSALGRALGEHGGTSGSPSGRITQNTNSSVIALLGSRGGVGTTTIAVNLAATLAAEQNNAVALLDLDLALGDADISLEVSGSENISIADLAHNIERLDMNFLRRALAKHEGTGLSILRHPLEIGQVGMIHEQHVDRIVNLLKMSYTHLILDLSKGLLPTDLTGLRLADQILLVAQLELASLRNVVRLLHCLGGEEGLVEKIRVVINRQGADTIEEGISIKKAEEVIGKPIFWQIPNESKSVIGARVAGHPLIKYAPKCAVQKSLVGLVQAMYGKPSAGGNKGSKGGWGLFGKRS